MLGNRLSGILQRFRAYARNQSCILLTILMIFSMNGILLAGCSAKGVDTQETTQDSAQEETESITDLTQENLPDMKIICFPVGKGDAFLIKTEHANILIDTGYDQNGDEIGTYLRDTLGITTINYMIITHYDKDHVGGADKIMQYVDVVHVVLDSFVKESTDTTELFQTIASQRTDVIYPGREISDDINSNYTAEEYDFELDQVSYKVYPCQQEEYDTKDSNNSSLIVTAQYGDNSFLFMGDAESERISEFLDEHDGEHYDWIKMPHHGSYSKEVRKLIESVSPEYAVITDSTDKLADDDTLKLLQKKDITTYQTSNGAVLFISNGSEIQAWQTDDDETTQSQ